MTEKITRTTFITKDKSLEQRLMFLGHAFSQAVAEGENELAHAIQAEALRLKEGIDIFKNEG